MDERLDSIMQELSFDKEFLFHVDDSNLGRKIDHALSAALSRQAAIRKKIQVYTEENKQKLACMGLFMKYYLTAKLRAVPDVRGISEETCFDSCK